MIYIKEFKHYSAFLLFCVALGVTALDTSHQPIKFLDSIKKDANRGEKIYQSFCSHCHAIDPKIKVGAPRFRLNRDWSAREKKGLQGLLKSLEDNLGMMPARGGCFECDDAALKEAIRYMLPSLHQK